MGEKAPTLKRTKVKLGVLWTHKDKNGKHYLTGRLGDLKLAIWRNDFKKKPGQPDYIMWLTQETKVREDEAGGDVADLPEAEADGGGCNSPE